MDKSLLDVDLGLGSRLRLLRKAIENGAFRRSAKALEGDGPALACCDTYGGTVTYMSPERLAGDKYGAPADVWGLGVTLFTCALGRFPYDDSGGFWGLLNAMRDSEPPVLPVAPSADDDGDGDNDVLVFGANGAVVMHENLGDRSEWRTRTLISARKGSRGTLTPSARGVVDDVRGGGEARGGEAP